jgi:hypothetical protein
MTHAISRQTANLAATVTFTERQQEATARGRVRRESMQWWVSLIQLAKKYYNSQTIKPN